MPQVTCPNCGMTINLENRKRIDFNLIVDAAKKQPRTFTELLHITKLSRKTLSLRLKDLCEKDTLVKDAGMYKLNGASEFENDGRNFVKGFSRAFHDRRIKTGLMLIALLIGYSTSGYVLARFFASPPQPTKINPGPVILGEFAMALDVSNVNGLYAWQAVITFNSSELKVIEATSGGFLEGEYPFFVNATDVDDGVLLLGRTLYGDAPGRDGSGRLAEIVFGYFTQDYEKPAMIFTGGIFDTYLLDSYGSVILIGNSTMLQLSRLN